MSRAQWGAVFGAVKTEWVGDRVMRLISPLDYRDKRGVWWFAPAGLLFDGASIPKALWSIVGDPYTGAVRTPAVFHDAAYKQRKRPRWECDRMFYELLRCHGMSAMRARTMWAAVRTFGPRW